VRERHTWDAHATRLVEFARDLRDDVAIARAAWRAGDRTGAGLSA
jgi:hypothetical protein